MNSCFDSMFFHIAIVATTTGSNIAQGDLPSGPGPVLRVRVLRPLLWPPRVLQLLPSASS